MAEGWAGLCRREEIRNGIGVRQSCLEGLSSHQGGIVMALRWDARALVPYPESNYADS